MGEPQDPTQKIVIIGAGIVGVNLAHELLLLGWSDITVVEQGPLALPGGSTSHAPGLVFQTNSSKTMAQLAQYTVKKLSALEKDGESCFDALGGLEVATSSERLLELKRRHGWATSWGIPARLVSPEECLELYPLLDGDLVLAGLHTPTDGLAKAARAVQLLIDRTSRAGVRYLGNTPVTGIDRANNRVHAVHTPSETLQVDILVCCAGFWGVELGNMLDVSIPLVPLAHQYAKTASIPALAKHDECRMPILRHQDQDLYYRTHGDALGVGFYGHKPMPVSAATLGPTPEHVTEETQPSRLPFTSADFAPAWSASKALLPALDQTEIGDAFNGIFSFTPDGGPLLGPVPGLDNAHAALAVWVTHSAGAARAVAQQITYGAAEVDLSECLLSRFNSVQLTPSCIRKTSAQSFEEVYKIVHPWAPRTAPRGLRLSPLHARLYALGAVFADANAWERAEYFTANTALIPRLPDSWRPRSRDEWSGRHYSPAVAAECWKARSAVAMFDLTCEARVRVVGPGAVPLLQRLCTRDVSFKPGNVVDALFLNAAGRIRAEVRVARIAEQELLLTVSSQSDVAYLQAEARRQVNESPAAWCIVEDVADATCCVGVWGPHAAALMHTPGLVETADLFASDRCVRVILAGIPALAIRVAPLGEDGWEIYTAASQGVALWDALWRAGQRHGVAAAGRLAYLSLRLEADGRHFGADFTSEHDPSAAGVGHMIDPGKVGFVGYDALRGLVGLQPMSKLYWLHGFEGSEGVVMGKEPVFCGERVVGYVANAAFGHDLGRLVMHAWLDSRLATGDEVSVEYFGKMVPAMIGELGQKDAASLLIPSRL